MRRFLYAFSLVAFERDGYMQWVTYIALSYSSLIMLILVRPFKSKIVNAFEIYNEATILLIGYAIFWYQT